MSPKTTTAAERHQRRSVNLAADLYPFVPVVLVGLNGLYMLLVAFGNITDYDSNAAFVQHVLTMDTTNFGSPAGTGLDPDVIWRAITTPWVQTVAYLGIITWEVAAAAVLVAATISWARTASKPERHRRAQRQATIGLLMIITLFFGGFICIGGEWFAMYRSTAWNGLDPAFRNSVLAILTLLAIQQSTPSRCS